MINDLSEGPSLLFLQHKYNLLKNHIEEIEERIQNICAYDLEEIESATEEFKSQKRQKILDAMDRRQNKFDQILKEYPQTLVFCLKEIPFISPTVDRTMWQIETLIFCGRFYNIIIGKATAV
jgi:hypothetical protein